jgi:hypothetical protein
MAIWHILRFLVCFTVILGYFTRFWQVVRKIWQPCQTFNGLRGNLPPKTYLMALNGHMSPLR